MGIGNIPKSTTVIIVVVVNGEIQYNLCH